MLFNKSISSEVVCEDSRYSTTAAGGGGDDGEEVGTGGDGGLVG
jgi:hypothetical protein